MTLGKTFGIVWRLAMICSPAAGFCYGAITWGFWGAIGCAILAFFVVTIAPFVLCAGIALACLYFVYLLITFIAWPWTIPRRDASSVNQDIRVQAVRTTQSMPPELHADSAPTVLEEPDPTFVSAFGVNYGQDEAEQLKNEKASRQKREDWPPGVTQEDVDALQRNLREMQKERESNGFAKRFE